jgi:CHAT domain-containing protein/tetratricopeptide (TPR) repeat protein
VSSFVSTRLRVLLWGLIFPALAVSSLAGENEAREFVVSTRQILTRGDMTQLIRQVEENRGTAYEAVDLLLNGTETNRFAIAQPLARAYREAFGEACLEDRVAVFRSWTRAQSTARAEAKKLKEAAKRDFAAGRMAAATAKFHRALSEFRRLGDVREEGRCLANLGSVAVVQGDDSAALDWTQRAQETFQRSGDLGLLLSTGINRAYALESKGDLRSARTALEEVLPTARSLGDRQAEGAVLLNLGSVSQGEGSFDESLRLFRLAAQVGQEVNDAEIESSARSNVGVILSGRGDLESARQEFEKAADIARRGGKPRAEAEAELNLADVLRLEDYSTQALGHVARARKIDLASDAVLPRARTELEEGLILNGQGMNREALRFFDSAEKALKGADAPEVLSGVFEGRGIAYYYLGRYAEAQQQLRLSMGKSEEGGRAGEGADARRNLGLCRFLLGDASGALEDLEDAARIHEAAGNARERGLDLDALGALRFRSGDLQGARRALTEALAVLPVDSAPIDRAEASADLAALELASGPDRRQEGLALNRMALATFKTLDDLHGIELVGIQEAEGELDGKHPEAAAAALERTRSLARGRIDREFEWKLLWLEGRVAEMRGDGKLAGQRYTGSVTEVERLRGGVRPDLWRAAILEDRIAPYLALSRWHRRRHELEEAYLVARMAKSRTFTERLSAPVLTASRGPREGNEEWAPLTLVPHSAVPLHDLQERLEPGEVLLDYFFDDEGLEVFVVGRRTFRVVPLRGAGKSEKELRELLEAFRYPGRPGPSDATIEKIWETVARRAGAVLIEPLLSELEGIENLLIVPTGPLNGIPFAALEVGGRHLVEERIITLLPAAEMLLSRGDAPRPRSVSTLALAASAGSSRDPALPDAEEEVRRVATCSSGTTRVITGAQAQEALFRKEAASYSRIHIAAHARIDPLMPVHSSLMLAPGGGEDGRLEVSEIATLHLGASLVVLSGCGTAREEGLARGTPPGDERVGLVRAFLTAGAEEVIASLWELEDRSARRIVPEIYSRLDQCSPAQALAYLQRDLLAGRLRDPKGRRLDHPFYWAGLAAYGADRFKPQPSRMEQHPSSRVAADPGLECRNP